MAQNQIRPVLISPAEFKALRKSTGLSQRGLAHALGLATITVGYYERGKRPAPKHVITLMQILAAKRQALITNHRQAIFDAIDAPFDISL